jgi:succinyl-diaminopimelate desuccinylase
MNADLQDLLSRLVAADSSNPPGDERAVASEIESAATRLGLPMPQRYERDPQRPNLVIELGAGSPRLLIGAHMDTVPAGPEDAWSSNPFELHRNGDRLNGLGVADMKGALAASLVAAATLHDRDLRGTLVLAFTADEEATCESGMSWLCEQRLLEADAAVLLEPASDSHLSWDALYLAQRGSCVVRLTARGEPGHSGQSLRGDQRAGRKFIRALSALESAELLASYRHPLDATPPLVNLPTMVAGGITPWQHPAALDATIEIRTVPQITPEIVLAELRGVLERDGLQDVELELVGWGAPGEVVADERLINAATSALALTVGERLPAVFPATTDAAYLAAIGIPAIPALGPGTLRAIHKPDEWLLADDLERSVTLIRDFVAAYFLERFE